MNSHKSGFVRSCAFDEVPLATGEKLKLTPLFSSVVSRRANCLLRERIVRSQEASQPKHPKLAIVEETEAPPKVDGRKRRTTVDCSRDTSQEIDEDYYRLCHLYDLKYSSTKKRPKDYVRIVMKQKV